VGEERHKDRKRERAQGKWEKTRGMDNVQEERIKANGKQEEKGEEERKRDRKEGRIITRSTVLVLLGFLTF